MSEKTLTITESQLRALVQTAVAELGAAQVVTRTAEKSRPVPKNPDAPVSFRQRKLIAVLSGTFPTDAAGYGAMKTMADASRVIDALQAGKTVKIGRKTLNPVI